MDELGHLPGVLFAGVATNIPFSGADGKSAVTVGAMSCGLGNRPAGITPMVWAATTSARWVFPCGWDGS
jgi:hypothetical protein